MVVERARRCKRALEVGEEQNGDQKLTRNQNCWRENHVRREYNQLRHGIIDNISRQTS